MHKIRITKQRRYFEYLWFKCRCLDLESMVTEDKIVLCYFIYWADILLYLLYIFTKRILYSGGYVVSNKRGTYIKVRCSQA